MFSKATTTLIIFTLALSAAAGEQSPKTSYLFAHPFGNNFSTYMPTSRTDAKNFALSRPAIELDTRAIARLFIPDSSLDPRLDTIRVAVKLGENWLFVDKNGKAEYKSKIGSLDVHRLEDLLYSQAPRGWVTTSSDGVILEVINRSNRTVRVLGQYGLLWGEVPANSSSSLHLLLNNFKITDADGLEAEITLSGPSAPRANGAFIIRKIEGITTVMKGSGGRTMKRHWTKLVVEVSG